MNFVETTYAWIASALRRTTTGTFGQSLTSQTGTNFFQKLLKQPWRFARWSLYSPCPIGILKISNHHAGLNSQPPPGYSVSPLHGGSQNQKWLPKIFSLSAKVIQTSGINSSN